MKENLIETHGKVEGKPTTLEQIWGFNELYKYQTKDEAQYSFQLDEYNRTDLERHARTVGVVVVESTERLKKNLLNEFRKYYSQLYKPENTIPINNGKVSHEVKKILAEGR